MEDKLHEVASSLIAAYDSGEIPSALAEGQGAWQKWVKAFGKSMKRKVSHLFNPVIPAKKLLFLNEKTLQEIVLMLVIGEITFHATTSVVNGKTPWT